MPVNKLVITVVFQEMHTLLNYYGGDQAIKGIANGNALTAKFAVNGCAQFKG